MATKPMGELLESKATTTPISASGATAKTRNNREKLCSWIIRMVAITNSMSGTTAAIGAWLLPLSSTLPPTSILYPGGSFSAKAFTSLDNCATIVLAASHRQYPP